MGLFKKESRTRFIRDSTGKVINIEQTGDNNETRFDRAAKERQARREARQRERQERRYEQKYQRVQEREAYRKAYNEARIKRKQQLGQRAGSTTGFERFAPARRVVVVHTGKKTGKTKKKGGPQKQHPMKKMVSPDQWMNNMMKKWGW